MAASSVPTVRPSGACEKYCVNLATNAGTSGSISNSSTVATKAAAATTVLAAIWESDKSPKVKVEATKLVFSFALEFNLGAPSLGCWAGKRLFLSRESKRRVPLAAGARLFVEKRGKTRLADEHVSVNEAHPPGKEISKINRLALRSSRRDCIKRTCFNKASPLEKRASSKLGTSVE
eukprot:IDg21663t1